MLTRAAVGATRRRTFSECINAVLKGTHRLPVAAIIRATYDRLQQLFVRKGKESVAQLNAGM
ncbi:hypothetical protein PIB30_085970, partial [Stylosanthes scabra]|nr:hypothetical protein [Stylosanthes scabra]